eukprot:g596.t1
MSTSSQHTPSLLPQIHRIVDTYLIPASSANGSNFQAGVAELSSLAQLHSQLEVQKYLLQILLTRAIERILPFPTRRKHDGAAGSSSVQTSSSTAKTTNNKRGGTSGGGKNNSSHSNANRNSQKTHSSGKQNSSNEENDGGSSGNAAITACSLNPNLPWIVLLRKTVQAFFVLSHKVPTNQYELFGQCLSKPLTNHFRTRCHPPYLNPASPIEERIVWNEFEQTMAELHRILKLDKMSKRSGMKNPLTEILWGLAIAGFRDLPIEGMGRSRRRRLRRRRAKKDPTLADESSSSKRTIPNEDGDVVLTHITLRYGHTMVCNGIDMLCKGNDTNDSWEEEEEENDDNSTESRSSSTDLISCSSFDIYHWTIERLPSILCLLRLQVNKARDAIAMKACGKLVHLYRELQKGRNEEGGNVSMALGLVQRFREDYGVNRDLNLMRFVQYSSPTGENKRGIEEEKDEEQEGLVKTICNPGMDIDTMDFAELFVEVGYASTHSVEYCTKLLRLGAYERAKRERLYYYQVHNNSETTSTSGTSTSGTSTSGTSSGTRTQQPLIRPYITERDIAKIVGMMAKTQSGLDTLTATKGAPLHTFLHDILGENGVLAMSLNGIHDIHSRQRVLTKTNTKINAMTTSSSSRSGEEKNEEHSEINLDFDTMEADEYGMFRMVYGAKSNYVSSYCLSEIEPAVLTNLLKTNKPQSPTTTSSQSTTTTSSPRGGTHLPLRIYLDGQTNNTTPTTKDGNKVILKLLQGLEVVDDNCSLGTLLDPTTSSQNDESGKSQNGGSLAATITDNTVGGVDNTNSSTIENSSTPPESSNSPSTSFIEKQIPIYDYGKGWNLTNFVLALKKLLVDGGAYIDLETLRRMKALQDVQKNGTISNDITGSTGAQNTNDSAAAITPPPNNVTTSTGTTSLQGNTNGTMRTPPFMNHYEIMNCLRLLPSSSSKRRRSTTGRSGTGAGPTRNTNTAFNKKSGSSHRMKTAQQKQQSNKAASALGGGAAALGGGGVEEAPQQPPIQGVLSFREIARSFDTEDFLCGSVKEFIFISQFFLEATGEPFPLDVLFSYSNALGYAASGATSNSPYPVVTSGSSSTTLTTLGAGGSRKSNSNSFTASSTSSLNSTLTSMATTTKYAMRTPTPWLHPYAQLSLI